MFFAHNTFQATLTVCVTLVGAFLLTGFASSAYHRERTALGITHFEHGQSLEKQGHLEPALEEYRKALLFAPDKPEYQVSLATALLEAGRLDEAQTHLEELLQEDPTSGPLNLLLARLAVRQKNLKKAIEYYQRGVYEYWPESQLGERRRARWELANLLNKTGDRSGFIAELMQLYTNLPMGATDEQMKVGSLLLANGATSEASRIFRDIEKEAPQDAAARQGSGEVYFNSGEYISARHEFQRALRLDPKNAESQRMLSLTNEVIDMDPALPSINAAEQLRRSQNLLSRVVKDLEACGSAAPDVVPRLAAGRKLLVSPEKIADAAFSMQKTAAQLWADRASLCPEGLPPDRAIDTTLSRIELE